MISSTMARRMFGKAQPSWFRVPDQIKGLQRGSDLLQAYRQQNLSSTEKQHLFLKLGHLAIKNPKEYTETPEFAKLLAFMRGTMVNDALDVQSGVTRFEVLTTLVRLQTPDP